ncbi:superoxide dismutase family protein [Phenylobacterium sp. J426]|uniref:superoxide dismutase family protein n=1 Tax=Phenylobacterium sp. J426 TaxID=2898439 RepID=UPI002150B684|nr:superoxide dismutase family protein [Phenylobacterium sp. J426]MCR5874917.1 superoxide dismutase family protein [Phenylobacterium sp. J426]
MSRLFAVLAATSALAGAAPAWSAQAETLTAELKNGAGQTVGSVSLTEAPKGVVMRVEAKGLTPGWHGLHFHEKADCSKSDFTSAGAHTRHQGHGGEAKAVHGLLNPEANETGDLPNIHAHADGSAAAEVYTTLTTLKALRDADGSAVLIHANADDHKTQPIGGAGARVACAVIK